MGLADFQCEFRTVSGKGGSFHVYGLSLSDIAPIIRQHFEDIDALWSIAESALDGRAELTQGDIGRIAVALCEQAPGFVANVIARATREKADNIFDVAASLPAPLQIEALLSIIDLTFDEVGGVKKALESVARLLKTGQMSR